MHFEDCKNNHYVNYSLERLSSLIWLWVLFLFWFLFWFL
jgi:hypothetical protein